jgi:polysaccharide biosynthesis/export protein
MSTFSKLNLVKNLSVLLIVVIGAALSSCGSYKQNIMFKTSSSSKITQEKQNAESNYVIQKNDILTLELFTNQGEKIVDPNFESFKDSPSQPGLKSEHPTYLVDHDGIAKLPVLEEIKLEGLTVRQAEAMLQKEYEKKLSKGSFVVLKVSNKRVTVLGSPGGVVIPLVNENVRLTEVLALAGGINKEGKARNIRVLRGDKIFIADFSTVEGYLRDDMLIQSGDIIYVEPVRRPFLEALQNYGPIISLLTSVGTLVAVLITRPEN